MRYNSPGRLAADALILVLLLAGYAARAQAADSYDPASGQLTIPALTIGTAAYANMVIKVGVIVSPPSGTAGNGSEDSYDPGTNQLTVPNVTVGTTTYHNVVVTVARLVSVAAVTGADTYDGGKLQISLVQDGANTYDQVAITNGGLVSVAGGMPTFATDTYNSLTNELAIPAVQVGNRVYTNVIIMAGSLLSVGGIASVVQESLLHSFTYAAGTSADGANPPAGLIQGIDGALYGTTLGGGAFNGGSLFRITTAGTESIIYSFCAVSKPQCTDGYGPNGLIQGTDGNFYGTTQAGGFGAGTVFKVAPAGVETVLYAFCGNSGSKACTAGDGGLPQAGLVRDTHGNLYGTTFNGGAHNQGTVFMVTPAGVQTVLHSFTGNGGVSNSSDGAEPVAALILGADGNLYGTTEYGGANNLGTVFQVTAAGTETVLYSFARNGTDGRYPKAALVQGTDGNLYGTTSAGGSTNGGTVFRIGTAGGETVLYDFSEAGNSTDGYNPVSGLIQASDGNFYGTTAHGGAYNPGTAFRITPDGVETTLHSFNSTNGADGTFPQGGLVQAGDGNFYGTTYGGGASALGVVFRLAGVISAP